MAGIQSYNTRDSNVRETTLVKNLLFAIFETELFYEKVFPHA